jgi:hypothetical protein
VTATLPPITEAELQRLVVDAASLLGWSWLHVRPGRTLTGWVTPTTGPLGLGWPDLTLIRARDRRVLLLELKAAKGVVSAVQATCHELLRSAGLDVRVVRPRDIDALLDLLR